MNAGPADASGRLFAVGDVHGCIDELDALLDEIVPGAGDEIVFVGDYVDRGPSPSAVVERLIRLRDSGGPRCVFLRGNHEDMFLAWLGEPGRHGDAFLLNGGRVTLESYGISPALGGLAAKRQLPGPHLEFLRDLAMKHVRGRFLFVHAGISPRISLEKQRDEDLLWIREEFIRNRHPLPYAVVFGHTPHRDVVWNLPWKVGIDTGCVYGNKLTCLELRSATLFEVRRGSGSVTRRSVADELAPLEGLKAPADRV